MTHPARINTANDNAPLRAYPIAVNTRFAGGARTKPREFVTRVEPKLRVEHANETTPLIDKLTLAKRAWWATLVFAALTLFIPVMAPAQIGGAIAVLLSSLWTAHIARQSRKSSLLDLTCLTGILAFAGTVAIALKWAGAGLTLADGMALIGVTSLVFAGLNRSKLALITSCAASLLWVGATFAGITSPSIIFFAFPAIWSMQIYLASRLKTRAAILAGSAAGYYWLIGHGLAFMASGAISPAMAVSALFMVGIVHYRGGKAAEDEGAFGHETHVYIGWLVAALGAIFVTHYWLFPDNVLWQNMRATPTGLLGWKMAIALGVAAVYLSAMVRWKHRRMTSLAAIIMTIICALIPMTLWWETAVTSLVSTVPGLTASPVIGIVIAAGVLTASLGLALNGIRRGRLMMTLLGLVVAGAQGLVLMNPEILSFENVLVFFCAVLVAACTGGLLAGDNLTQMDIAKPLQSYPKLAA